MKTLISVKLSDENHRTIALDADDESGSVSLEISDRKTVSDVLSAVRIALVSEGYAPGEHDDVREIEAARRMQEEDATLDAEDILTQAEEANSLDPVG